jgi:guanylate kinase
MAQKLFTLTGPSCSGKTTLIRKLLETNHFSEVISFTSRQPRGGEVHGVDYYFLDAKTCEKLVKAGECAEHIKFKDNHYGILKSEIGVKFLEGKTPIVIVEPKGLVQLRKNYDCFVTYVDCDLVTLYTRFLSRFRQSPDANVEYEAKRVASIYLEQKEWLDKVKESGNVDFTTDYYEGREDAVVGQMVEFSKQHNNTK